MNNNLYINIIKMDDYQELTYLIDATLNNKESSQQSICKNCGSSNLVTDTQTYNIVCSNCGCIDTTNNNANNGLEIDSEHIVHKKSITKSLISSNTHHIKGLTNMYLKNIQLWNSITYYNRNLYLTFKTIKFKCKMLNLTKYVIDEVKILFYNVIVKYFENQKQKYNKCLAMHKQIKKKNISRGKNKLGLIGACIYYACKNTGYIKTIREIAKTLDITTACINNGCKRFLKYLKKTKIPISILISTPSNFIKSLSEYFNITGKQLEEYTDYIKKIEDNYLITTHTPFTIAVGATIYFYVKYNDNLNKLSYKELKSIIKMIAKKINCSGTIIMMIYDIILQYDEFLFGNGVLNKQPTPELNDITLQTKIKEIEMLDENNYCSVDNINIYSICLSIHENIFNNQFTRSLKFL